jgi:thiosulfate dehydrogenase [quinone] large subunit
MSTNLLHRHHRDVDGHDSHLTDNRAVGLLAGLARLSLGWVFLWAFLDKTFGFGFATENKDSWLEGGSPTFGFLTFGAAGPFKGTYNDIAGQAWADWLFMLGLLGIGVALMAGVFMNLASWAGTVLLVLMWTAVLPPENNPFMDDHLVYALVLLLLAAMGAGRWLGLGGWWERQDMVQKHPVLR